LYVLLEIPVLGELIVTLHMGKSWCLLNMSLLLWLYRQAI
jgi:hypothetical protein